MPGRNHRSTRGQLPKHLEGFMVNMSGSSTPKVSDNGQDGSGSSSLDNTVVEQQEAGDGMLSCLMERIKALEDNNQRTMQQLVENEIKRLHLQEKLANNKTTPPTPGVVVTSEVPYTTGVETIVRDNTTFSHGMSQLATSSAGIQSSLQQQYIASVTTSPIQSQSTSIPTQQNIQPMPLAATTQ